MRLQYGHSCGSLIPPLVGGGIRSCVGDDDDIDDDDEDDDDAGTIVFCGPTWLCVSSFFVGEKKEKSKQKTKQYNFGSKILIILDRMWYRI